MRARLACAGFLIALAAALPGAAFAAGDVLLPDSSGGSGAPNLGLGGGSSAPASSAPAPQPQQEQAQQPAAQTESSPPPQQAQQIPPLDMKTPAMPDIKPIISPAPENAHLKPGELPTRIIHAPNDSAFLAQANAKLPYSLTITPAGQSYFSAGDVKTIGAKLGLSRDAISSDCMLGLRGVVQTTKGAAIIDSGASPRATVRYDGRITGYMMSAQALCAVGGNLPPASGFITEIGGRYLVPLGAVQCAAPSRQVSSLTITYTGGAGTRCTYD